MTGRFSAILLFLSVVLSGSALVLPVGNAAFAQRVSAGAEGAVRKRVVEADEVVNSDPERANALLAEAEGMLPSIGNVTSREVMRARILLVRAAIARLTNSMGEAEQSLDAAIDLLSGIAPESEELGEAYRSLAALYAETGRPGESLNAATRAHDILRANGALPSQALSLQIIGSLYGRAGDYERALRYFQEASDVYSGTPSTRLAVENNVAFTLIQLQRYEEALESLTDAYEIATQQGNQIFAARILMNVAATRAKLGDWSGARTAINNAEDLARSASSENWLPFISGVRAQIAYGTGNADIAAGYLDQAFEGLDLTQTDGFFRDFHEVAYNTYQETGDSELALQHLLALKRLDDESAALTASATNALIGARFDFANQELEIATLRAGQLERDVQIAEQAATFNRRIVIFVVLASVVVVGVTFLALLNIRRRRDEVNAANVELEKTNTSLAKALDAKSEFLATTSHEIRTPLNGILGMTQVMLADGTLAPEYRERVELVHGAGTTMKAIVDDILDVAKLDSGKVSLKSELFGLAATLREVGRVFADEAESKGLHFDCRLDGCPEWAIGDEQRVRQIVFNLVSNAVKFTTEGEVILAAGQSDTNPDVLMLCVADTGIGIPEAEQDAIFSPFHQVDGSRTRQYSGTGLGLTISRELTMEMGGDLSVASTPGKGAEFRLTLPLDLREAQVQGAGPGDDGAESEATSDAIVYAPNALLLAVATRALEKRDLAAVFTESYEQALQKVETSGASTLLLVFGRGPIDAEYAQLRESRAAHPKLRIVAAGWPDNWPSDEGVLTAHAADATGLLGALEEAAGVGASTSGEPAAVA